MGVRSGSLPRPARRILVTGCAGFIGSAVSRRLLEGGASVVGIDNLNSYYSPKLKLDRLEPLLAAGLDFRRIELANRAEVEVLFTEGFDRVIHLAAQAGVRYSSQNPHVYIDSNIVGFLHVLEGCRHNRVPHLVYASSSSVYGLNTSMPFSEKHPTAHPVSLYGATKKSNEMMAHAYAHSYGLPVTGLRFFTVYGPWGRPDMTPLVFARAILDDKPIRVYNHGQMQRDFTYVDDIVEGILRITEVIPSGSADWSGDEPDPSTSSAPYRIYNIGNHSPVQLGPFIELIEKNLGRVARKEYLPLPAGDVVATYADVADISRVTGFHPSTPIEIGVERAIRWFVDYRAKNHPLDWPE